LALENPGQPSLCPGGVALVAALKGHNLFYARGAPR
jgi:hypothetical protein